MVLRNNLPLGRVKMSRNEFAANENMMPIDVLAPPAAKSRDSYLDVSIYEPFVVEHTNTLAQKKKEI